MRPKPLAVRHSNHVASQGDRHARNLSPSPHHRGGPCRWARADRHPGLAPQPRRRSSAAPRVIPCWRWIARLNEIPNLEETRSITSCLARLPAEATTPRRVPARNAVGSVDVVVSVADIVRHHDPDPDHNPWVHGPPPVEPVEIVAYDAQWPDRFAELAAGIRRAMGPRALAIEHVGSTAVPGLAGKNVVDIDLTVTNPADEEAYVPALSSIGYILTVREPSLHEHRCLRLQSPPANVHVFGSDCPETIRHRMFRDWLST